VHALHGHTNFKTIMMLMIQSLIYYSLINSSRKYYLLSCKYCIRPLVLFVRGNGNNSNNKSPTETSTRTAEPDRKSEPPAKKLKTHDTAAKLPMNKPANNSVQSYAPISNSVQSSAFVNSSVQSAAPVNNSAQSKRKLIDSVCRVLYLCVSWSKTVLTRWTLSV